MTLDRTQPSDGHETSLKDTWRAVLGAIDDRILRACLPIDVHAVLLDDEGINIAVDSEFKKEYCLRKIEKIESAVSEVLGHRAVTIGEPPLIEKAQEETTRHGAPARILVMGIGDGGVNAVGRMREERLQGVRLVAVDTDRQVLDAAAVPETLQIGRDITNNRGTGGKVDVGLHAAQDSHWEIANLVRGMDLVFITAGLGGGTGSGAAPVAAQIAREQGALTVGVVTRPFSFEGNARRARAEAGLDELRRAADVLIVISNDRLLESSTKGMPMTKAFEMADSILHQGVRGISDLITIRGLINLDFADIRSILHRAGEAMMGMGLASGKQRAVAAAKLASMNPLLEGNSILGARKLIMNVTGGSDLTLGEVTAAADHVRKATGTECDLVFGAVVHQGFEDGVQITVIAADFQGEEEMEKERRGPIRRERISRDQNLDVPTFLRRGREQEAEGDT